MNQFDSMRRDPCSMSTFDKLLTVLCSIEQAYHCHICLNYFIVCIC